MHCQKQPEQQPSAMIYAQPGCKGDMHVRAVDDQTCIDGRTKVSCKGGEPVLGFYPKLECGGDPKYTPVKNGQCTKDMTGLNVAFTCQKLKPPAHRLCEGEFCFKNAELGEMSKEQFWNRMVPEARWYKPGSGCKGEPVWTQVLSPEQRVFDNYQVACRGNDPIVKVNPKSRMGKPEFAYFKNGECTEFVRENLYEDPKWQKVVPAQFTCTPYSKLNAPN